ncbi:MAG: TetR/AcrR family transcriptional regulator [Oscillospiraceae bacterium]|nr:TetR/AcrR family transcriptional regulator [Oscillospiraceae bacterium]
MAKGFTDQEQVVIRRKLKDAARVCAVSSGMRKTTVEQLTRAADISKGAFYKFYVSKELLFFEILEDLHTEIYQASVDVLGRCDMLSPARRAAETILTACRIMNESGMTDFLEQDVPYLLRRIPAEVQAEHYHSDIVHITELLQSAGLTPHGGAALAAATVRGLLLMVSHRKEIGESYPQVLDTLVRGACERLFAAEAGYE